MPNIVGFSGSSLLHKGGGWEPTRKSNFAAVIFGVGGSDLVLALADTNVPAVQMNKQGLKHFNETMHYAGSVDPPEDWQLHYRDFVDRDIARQIGAWVKQVWDPGSGAIGLAGSYKKCGEIWFMGPGGNTTKIWRLDGVFPTQFNADNFDYSDDGGPQLLSLTCSVDRCMPPGVA